MISAYLVRHVESEKNVEDRHGGPGRALTQLGRVQLRKLAEFLTQEGCGPCAKVYTSSVEQVLATGRGLADHFGAELVQDQRLRPLNMGLVSGLSRKEAAEQFPEVAARLEEWRAGLLRIEDLQLPGSEGFEAFWSRGTEFLTTLIDRSSPSRRFVLVGTRSILILLTNILLQATELKGREYSVFEFDNGSVTHIAFAELGYGELVFLNRTDFLGQIVG